jgi:hypothetical protein
LPLICNGVEAFANGGIADGLPDQHFFGEKYRMLRLLSVDSGGVFWKNITALLIFFLH